MLTRQLAVLIHITRGFAAGQNTVQLIEPADQIFKFVANALFHQMCNQIIVTGSATPEQR